MIKLMLYYSGKVLDYDIGTHTWNYVNSIHVLHTFNELP